MNEGVKYDSEKVQLRLLPFKALNEVGKVLTYGANKYSPDNWKKVEPFTERYQDATLRHLFAYMEGELIDEESGLTHLAHAVTNILFLMEGIEECQHTPIPAINATKLEIQRNITKSHVQQMMQETKECVQPVEENFDEFMISLALNSEEAALQGKDWYNDDYSNSKD